MSEIVRAESKKNAIRVHIESNGIVPMWSLWRHQSTGVVWMLVGKDIWQNPYRLESVRLLDVKRREVITVPYEEFRNDINSGWYSMIMYW